MRVEFIGEEVSDPLLWFLLIAPRANEGTAGRRGVGAADLDRSRVKWSGGSNGCGGQGMRPAPLRNPNPGLATPGVGAIWPHHFAGP